MVMEKAKGIGVGSKGRRLQNKSGWGGAGGRAQRLPPQCVPIWGSGGSKGRLAQAAGAEPSGQMRDAKVHVVVARSTFRSQNLQTPHARATFGGSDVVSRDRRKGLCTLSKVSKA